jgi:guanosine-3',5'-bis(diphosphate) 3'-pyrophosphohydrolase
MSRPIENRVSFKERLKVLSWKERAKIEFAYDLAKASHRPQLREGGERYFEHPRAVTLILLDECKIKDPELVIAALLHDTVEDTQVFGHHEYRPYSRWIEVARFRLEPIFGKNVTDMIIALTKPRVDGVEIKTKRQSQSRYLENLVKAPRKTLLVKMADRLHNLRTMGYRPKGKQEKVLRETRNMYLPLFEKALQDYPKEVGLLLSEIRKRC